MQFPYPWSMSNFFTATSITPWQPNRKTTEPLHLDGTALQWLACWALARQTQSNERFIGIPLKSKPQQRSDSYPHGKDEKETWKQIKVVQQQNTLEFQYVACIELYVLKEAVMNPLNLFMQQQLKSLTGRVGGYIFESISHCLLLGELSAELHAYSFPPVGSLFPFWISEG